MVDYSPYYLKNFLRKVPERTGEGRTPPKKNKRFLKTLLIVLVVASVLLLIDYFNGFLIVNKIKGAFTGGDNKYYVLIASEHESETEAVASATVVRANGGAGYIIYEKEHYYVALATYLSREDAETVERKNDGTFIYEIEAGFSLFPDTALGEKARTILTESAEKLNSVSERYCKKTLSASSALQETSDIRNDLLNLKAEIVDAELGEEGDSLLSVVDDAFSAAEALLSGGYSTTELESVFRYVVTLFAYSMR